MVYQTEHWHQQQVVKGHQDGLEDLIRQGTGEAVQEEPEMRSEERSLYT